jgi:hypothetical protein
MKKQTISLFKKCKSIISKQQDNELKKYHVSTHKRIMNIQDVEACYNMFQKNIKHGDFGSAEYCLKEMLETSLEVINSHNINQNFEGFLNEISNIEVLFDNNLRKKYIHRKFVTSELINFWSEIISWTLNKIETMKCEGTVLTEIEEKYSID